MRQQFPSRPGFDSSGDYDSEMNGKRQLALNIERQKRMVADTNKLLKMARELNDEVAASNAGTLTPEQLHKIAEIEKLARSVKERMTTGSAEPQSVFTLLGLIIPLIDGDPIFVFSARGPVTRRLLHRGRIGWASGCI